MICCAWSRTCKLLSVRLVLSYTYNMHYSDLQLPDKLMCLWCVNISTFIGKWTENSENTQIHPIQCCLILDVTSLWNQIFSCSRAEPSLILLVTPLWSCYIKVFWDTNLLNPLCDLSSCRACPLDKEQLVKRDTSGLSVFSCRVYTYIHILAYWDSPLNWKHETHAALQFSDVV